MGAELYYSAAFYFYSEQEGFEVKVEWDAWEYPIGTIECVNVECAYSRNFGTELHQLRHP
jgi:hypothetical protein